MKLSAAQPKGSARPIPQPPRRDLLPAKLRRMVGQPKIVGASGGAWRGAPRPELLPGMGPTRVGGLRRVAQARPRNEVSTTPIPAGQLRVIGQGRPLEAGIRRTMESFFEADFSAVRVHEGPAAQAMGALAFTLGEELHFAPGLYDPVTREGVELLGHELTHVLQQRDGRVANPYGQGVAIVQDPALEAEADRMGQRIADEMWPPARVGQPSMKHGPNLGPFSRPGPGKHRTAGPLAIQPSWAQIASIAPSSGGGGKKGSGGSGGTGGQGGKPTTVKKSSPPTIIITNAARKHYTHHRSLYLPTTDIGLQQLVESSWNDFEDRGDGTYYLDLDEYDTKRTSGIWEPRQWFIIITRADEPNSWIVTHFGPAS